MVKMYKKIFQITGMIFIMAFTFGFNLKDKAFYSPSDKNIQYYGRWEITKESARASWGATYFKIKFEGKFLAIKLGKNQPYCWYSIDGNDFIDLIPDRREIYVLAENLKDGIHTLEFVKIPESSFGILEINGIYLEKGKRFLEPEKKPEKKIEFVGDSITATPGFFENEKPGPRFLENGYLAYGPVLARMLNADYHVEGMSGIGAYRNYNEPLPPKNENMNDFFLRTIPQEKNSKWDFNLWKPDVLIIGLSTNDFIKVDDKWQEPDKQGFKDAYKKFLNLVRNKYPETEIVCLGPWLKGKYFSKGRDYIKEAVKEYNDKKIHFINPASWLSQKDFVNDKIHPTVEGHKKIAKRLYKIVKPLMK